MIAALSQTARRPRAESMSTRALNEKKVSTFWMLNRSQIFVSPRFTPGAHNDLRAARCAKISGSERSHLACFVEPLRNVKLIYETFADQAVVAIENARLFQELKESLEQQTATE